MSKKVDERVVEMRFDNQQFESGVKTTMSTLDKLKAALKFPSSTKSLDSISNAAKKVDFSGMQKGIETVNARFSAMQVVGITALSNITSAAMRAGTNLVKSFTIEPVISGFQEYETQLNSVQTILANTSSKGTTIDDVTAALDELNTYADQTIYNFTEMTRNIGTFTAAGVDLDASVSAIKGIANLAAVSGSTSTQASTAMYQLSQALAAGRVSLMDWNSVVNAGMGGEVFQNALKRTATVMGKDVDGLIKKYGSFRESLTSGEWLTTDVLTETLAQFTMAAKEGTAEWDQFKASLMEKGYTEAQAVEILKMANTATDAATKVKTFTQLMDTLKEAMGSGWAKTWQLIFGDFEEAKAFWTDISNWLGELINGMSDARNSVIEGAMGGGTAAWDEFSAKIKDAGVSTERFQQALKDTGVPMDDLIEKHGSLAAVMTSGEVSTNSIVTALKHLADTNEIAGASQEDLTKKLSYFQDVVNDVWMGDYKNGEERIEALTKAGYDYAEVQDLVNKTVDGHKLTLEDLSDAQLKAVGYTDDQIKAIRALAEEAEKAGTPLNELIDQMTRPSGRELFLESLKNLLLAILNPLQAVGNAFNSVFGLDSEGLYDLIAGFNAFTKSLVMDSDTIDNLTRTLKGLFAVIHLVATAAGNVFTIAFQVANTILGFFGTNLLEVTAILGDALFSLDRWITSGNMIEDILGGIGSAFSWIITPVKNFIDSVAGFPVIESAVKAVGDAFNWLLDQLHAFAVSPTNFFENLSFDFSWEGVLSTLSSFGSRIREIFSNIGTQLTTVGPDIIAGLQNGLSDGWERVVSFLTDLANKIVEAVKSVLGIHSPSTVFFDIGKNIIEGLVNGIEYLSGKVGETLTTIFEDITGALGTLDWGTILTVGAGVGTFAVFYQLTDALQSFGKAAENLTSPLEAFENFSKSFDKIASAKAFEMKAEAIKNIAISVAILAGSLVVLSMVDPAKLWSSVGALTVMGLVLAGIVAVAGYFGKGKASSGGIKEAVTQILDLAKLAGLMISIGASMLMLSGAMKIIGSMSEGEVKQAGFVLAAFAGVVAALIAITKIAGTGDLDAAAKFVGKIGTAFLILAVTARLLGGMSPGEMMSAGIMLAAFTGVVAALIAVTKFGGEYMDYAAKFVSKVGTAFLLLAVTAKIMGGMSPGEMMSAGIMLAAFTGVVAALIAVTKFAGNQVDKLSDFLLKVSAAFVLLGVAAKILGALTPDEMVKAGIAIGALIGVMTLLVGITHLAPKDQIAQISTTLLAMSASIAILAAVAALLGMVPAENLVKGIAAVAALSVLVGLLVMATKNAKDVKGTMIGIAVAIGVMAASIAILSLLDPARVTLATACMSAVMGMFALIVKMGSNVQTSMGVILAMVGAIAIIGAVVAVLANMPVAGVIASALSLSVLLIAMASALVILDRITGKASSLLISVGVMAVLGLVMAELGLVLAMMTALNVQSAIPNALALSILLVAMSAAMVPLSILGALAGGAIAAAASMAVVIGILGGLVVGLGWLFNEFEALGPALDTGIQVMGKIGEAIGSFISGFGVGLTSGLPEIGENLAAFGEKLNPFFSAISGVDPSVGETLTSLGVGLLALTSNNILDSLTSWFTGGTMNNVNEQFPMLGKAIAGFANAIGTADMTQATIGAMALKTVAQAMATIPNSGGLLGDLLGGKDYQDFSKGMTSMGASLLAFDVATRSLAVDTIQTRVDALKTVMEAMSGVPNSGGVLQDLLGEQDWSKFSTGMTQIGNGLMMFDTATRGLSEDIQPRLDTLKNLIEVMCGVPNSGGILQDLLGEQNFGNFSRGMLQIGNGLSNFEIATRGITDTERLTAIIAPLKNLIIAMTEIPTEGGWLDKLLGKGEAPNYATFGSGLGSLGSAITDFYTNTAGISDPERLGTVGRATTNLMNALSDMNTSDGSLLAQMILGQQSFGETFTSSMTNLAAATAAYGNKAAEGNYDMVSASVDAAGKILRFIKDTEELDTTNVSSFKEAVDTLATVNVAGMVEAFSAAEGNLTVAAEGLLSAISSAFTGDALNGAVQTVVDGMVSAFGTHTERFTAIGGTMTSSISSEVANNTSIQSNLEDKLSEAEDGAMNVANDFTSVGAAIGQGIYNGMGQWIESIKSRAAQMVRDAKTAAETEGDINSPSRVFRNEIGAMLGAGLVLGLKDYNDPAYKASSRLTRNAIDGMKNTLSGLNDALNTDLDVNPTIRPVLDLSDVRSGADSINGMFDSLVPMDVLGRVNSISRSMDSRIQNGSFNDVVGAIDKLRTNLSELGGTTYNVNGITYDDGTNVANAVNDLTRAIRLERRV